MTIPVNRCSQYFGAKTIQYIPCSYVEVENKLKALTGKYVLVMYPKDNFGRKDLLTTGGTLVQFACERIKNSKTGLPLNEVTLYFKEKRSPLVFVDEENEVKWIGSVNDYERLNRKDYFNELKAAQSAG